MTARLVGVASGGVAVVADTPFASWEVVVPTTPSPLPPGLVSVAKRSSQDIARNETPGP